MGTHDSKPSGNSIRHDRSFGLFWLLFAAGFGVTCIKPPYPGDFVLQHVLTVLAVAALILLHRRFRFTRLSFSCILAFLSLHVIGARYLYSYVPYDDWSIWLTGRSISEIFGFERNHYDRLVHFCYGLMLSVPVRELLVRFLKPPKFWSYILAVEIVLGTSALYELAEWGVAIILAPDWADRYNGQQGDIWDAQRDMAFALAGAAVSMTVVFFYNRADRSKR